MSKQSGNRSSTLELRRERSFETSAVDLAQRAREKAERHLKEASSLRATIDALSAAISDDDLPAQNTNNSFCVRITKSFSNLAEQSKQLNCETDTMIEHYEGGEELYVVLSKLVEKIEALEEEVIGLGKVMVQIGLPVSGIALPVESTL